MGVLCVGLLRSARLLIYTEIPYTLIYMDFIDKISADLLQNIGLGVLTLIVPVGIYVLEDRESKNAKYSELDRAIKIRLIDGGSFLIELGWIFLPLIFWNSVGLFVKLVILLSWATGIYLILKRVVKIYKKWVVLNDKDRDEIRLEILRSEKFDERMLAVAWDSIWSAKDMGTTTEEYFQIFSKKIEKCLKEGDKTNLDIASNLLRIFNSNFDNRGSIFILIFYDFFPKILIWHKEVWVKEYNLLGEKDDLNLWACYSEIIDKLNFAIRKTIERSLADRHSYILFKHLKSHLDKNGEEVIKKNGHDYEYLHSLPIFGELIEKISDASESYDIWNHYFPVEWKITEDNIKKSMVTRFWWHYYADWAMSRISSNEEKGDRLLDQVSEGLLPGINPITWAIISTFAFRSWSGDRIKSLIEWQRNFGFSVSGDGNYTSEETFWDDFRKEIEQKEDYTIGLACLLFRGSFREIDQNLKSLEELRFDDKDKENYRIEILGIFKKIKNCLDKIKSGQGVGN